MVEDLDSTIQVEQFGQAKRLLNRLLQSLDDENDHRIHVEDELKKASAKRSMNYESVADEELPSQISQISTSRDVKHGEVESRLRELELKRDTLMGRLQREEYLSEQFESIVKQHEKMLGIIKKNLKRRTDIETRVRNAYNGAVREKCGSYRQNIDGLGKLTSMYGQEYNATVGKVRKDVREYNVELNSGSSDNSH